mmetsp:Transcript_2759/g.3800  ORF Transcript_2759/g.3800 Transcript_2759/m.3800 type:complete len:96 (+) Transcript_2759:920-1207(+)
MSSLKGRVSSEHQHEGHHNINIRIPRLPPLNYTRGASLLLVEITWVKEDLEQQEEGAIITTTTTTTSIEEEDCTRLNSRLVVVPFIPTLNKKLQK